MGPIESMWRRLERMSEVIISRHSQNHRSSVCQTVRDLRRYSIVVARSVHQTGNSHRSAPVAVSLIRWKVIEGLDRRYRCAWTTVVMVMVLEIALGRRRSLGWRESRSVLVSCAPLGIAWQR